MSYNWQLYDCPGRDEANAEFDVAFDSVKEKLISTLDECEKLCRELCKKHFNLGACDGDTREVWDRKINKILNDYLSQ